MRIGLDIDGVMYQWERTARYMLRNVLPNSPYKEVLQQESTDWNWIKEQVSKKDWDWLWEKGIKLGLFRHGHLYPGTIEAVRELANIGDVIAVTSRPKRVAADTFAWIAYQKLPIVGLHILSSKEPKSTVRPMFDVFLDDKPENVYDLNDNTTCKAFLMRRSWNTSYVAPEVVSWEEFIGIVRGMKHEG